MKIRSVAAIAALVLLAAPLSGCGIVMGSLIDPGYVGLVVESYGSERGIENAKLVTGGRVRVNPVSETLYEYPVFFKTYQFSNNPQEGKDNSVTFSMGGSPVSLDLGVTYRFRYEAVDASKPQLTYLHEFFRLYRVSPDQFNETTLRNGLRDCSGSSASDTSPVEMATKPTQFVAEIQKCLANKFPQIEVKEVSLLGSPRLPEAIQNSINEAFKADQDAQTAIANSRKAEAEAKANVVRAEGEARVRQVQAQAEAQANRALAESITPQLLERERLAIERIRAEKWNGQQAPTIQTPNVQLGGSQAAAK